MSALAACGCRLGPLEAGTGSWAGRGQGRLTDVERIRDEVINGQFLLIRTWYSAFGFVSDGNGDSLLGAHQRKSTGMRTKYWSVYVAVDVLLSPLEWRQR